MIENILGGGIIEALSEGVKCGCGCGCGTWSDDYRRGNDAGTSAAVDEHYNPQ